MNYVYRLMKKIEDDEGNVERREIGFYKTRKSAEDAIMKEVINVAQKNMHKAIYLKGAIRGQGRNEFNRLNREIRYHNMYIEEVYLYA
jgi:hypothetical protein